MDTLICIIGEEGSGRRHVSKILEDKYDIKPLLKADDDDPIMSCIISEAGLVYLMDDDLVCGKVFSVRVFGNINDDSLVLGVNDFDYFIYNDFTNFINVRVSHLINYIRNNGKPRQNK